MAAELINRLGFETTETIVERMAKQALENGIAAGENENTILQRIVRAFRDPNSDLARAYNAIPGASFAPHLGFVAVAEVLDRSADSFFAGDNRPLVRAVRFLMKAMAPALIGTGEAVSDVLLDGQITTAVTRTITQHAEVYISPELPDRILIPARNADGTTRLGPDGRCIFLDRAAIHSRAQWENNEANKAKTRQEGSGKNRKSVSVPAVPWPQLGPMSLLEALACVDPDRLMKGDVDALMKLLAPAPSGGQWTPATLAVIRADMRSCARFQREGRYDWLDHAENEGLSTTFMKARRDGTLTVSDAHELIGVAFLDRIGTDGAPAGEFSFDVAEELHQQGMDKWTPSDQPGYTKVVRALRRIHRSAVNRGVSGWHVALLVAAASWIIWLPAALFVALSVKAARMYIHGLYGVDANEAATNVCWAAIIVFLVTCTFPVAQAFTGWLTRIAGHDKDWLKSYGRRIAAFVIVLCDITGLAITMGIAPDSRQWIPLVLLMPVAAGFLFVEANRRYEAELAAVTSAKALIFIGSAHLVLFVFLDGWISAHTEKSESFSHWVTGLLVNSKWFQLAAVLGVALLVSVGLSWFKYRKVPNGTRAGLRVAGAGPLLTFIVLTVAAGIFFPGACRETSTASVPVTPTEVVTSQASPVPDAPAAPVQAEEFALDVDEICADPDKPREYKKMLGCAK
ncbi:hypothetical protein HY631_02480 [Candidatus Uhrbacteria bacterium]|nr:hypothetical protein [Candidatus Uhrbacteria bacterium]